MTNYLIMGCVYQLDTSQTSNSECHLPLPPFLYPTPIFNMVLAFYHGGHWRPGLTWRWHQERCVVEESSCWTWHCLEPLDRLASDRCPVPLWVPWNCKYSVVPCGLLLCPGHLGIHFGSRVSSVADATGLRIPRWEPLVNKCLKEITSSYFLSFFSFSLIILNTLEMSEKKKCRKTHTNLPSMICFISVAEEVDGGGIGEWIKIPQKELSGLKLKALMTVWGCC